MTEFYLGDYVEWTMIEGRHSGIWMAYDPIFPRRSFVQTEPGKHTSVRTDALTKVELLVPGGEEADPITVTYPAPGSIDSVQITLTFTQAIGLYKMALAINHPSDNWVQPEQLQRDEDVGPLSAALLVHLRGVIE